VSIPVAPDSIYGHLAAAKLHFPDWLVTDYVLSLATKPFVILSGISGTGKTKLAQAVSAFLAPDWEAEVVVAPGVESLGEGFTRVQVIPSAIKHRRLIIPTALVEGFAVPEYPEAFDFTVRADGQVFPARLYGHPTARTLQVHMKPELYSWFSNNVKTGDYIGMRLNPIEEEVPDFELEIRTLPVERRTEKRPSARVAFLSVRPDWTDNRGLLGYYNPLMREYAATELLRLLLRAQAHPDEPHFVILDEMNLAKVEYYFSDFLSAMESGTEMVLHDASEELYVNSAEGPLPVPQRLVVPQNVLFTGTVNVDETTYMFSPKVLDRANTIEFNEVSLDTYGADGSWDSGEFRLREGLDLNSILRSRKPEMEDWVALSDEYKDRLRSLHAVMENHNLHFGYRVANEVARYLLLAAECVGEEQLETAFDLQILQKVLPKLAGNRAKLYQPIRELLAWCIDPDGEGGRALAPGSAGAISLNSARYPRSAVKLRRMLETLETVGFVSFVE
jgi:energy-coupling factor transporter ATP-binding protein EcfA2